jgi:hypothetical protein
MQQKDAVHVVSKLSGGLADFGEVFSATCPQQHDEQQGRKAQRRKGGRAIDSGSRGG